ncbi:hypothetical protein AAF712_003952 [Marasmius tenuissimus]|uniref:Fe2OG dioxygenase domain-containing protein n=1 Tax=Marasmius tenuissimus TaxID=585030 RepID=A0ABR3A6F6_9AGAR
MPSGRQTRSGRRHVEVWQDLGEVEVVTIKSSCPPLENLLQEALERESQPIDDPFEDFDSPPVSQTTPTPQPTVFAKKRCAPEEDDATQSKKGKNWHRHGKRQKRREEQFSTDGHLRSHHLSAIQTCQTIPSSLNVAELPAANGGFIGQDTTGPSRNVRDAEWYRSQPDWDYVEWDGSKALLLVDEAQRIFLVGLKKVQDPSYNQDMIKAANLLEDARTTKLVLRRADLSHLRGHGFAAAATGWSMGGGQDKVTHSAGKHEEVMQSLIGEPCMRRLASTQDAGFACWSFKNYEYYKDSMDQLRDSIKGFKPNFERSQFASVTCNFGPRVCTSIHTDAKNCPHSMCAITAVGQFEPSKGGHLVLPDLKIIIEFSSGCTFLLPSAVLRHGNTPVRGHETRYSITQYSAGGIFRWLEYGQRTEDQFRRQDPVGFRKAMAERDERWHKMIDMFVTIDEVRRYHGVQ